jgi:hypothetical protein
MINKLVFFMAIALFFSCKSATRPSYQLSDEQLAQVMLDLHMADVILPQLHADQQDSVKQLFWRKMSVAYQMPEADLQREMELLESDPEKLKLIVNRVKELADSIP